MYRTPQGLNIPFGDRQTQARTRNRANVGGSEEYLKEARLVLFWNANTFVAHLENDLFRIALDVKIHASTGW